MAGQEEDWEYASEDGEDYSWEYEEEEAEEAAPEIPKDVPKKEEPKVEPKPAVKEEEAPKVERRSRAAVQAEREKEEKEKKEQKAEEAAAPMGREGRNAIMEQMKRLQEGYNDLNVDISDLSESETESDSPSPKPVRAKPKKKEESEEDLSDLDLLDPFGSEPVPVVQKKAVPQNGNGRKEETPEGDRKHRKHRRKSTRHESTFEKFRNLEQKEKNGGEENGKLKKIHVRSKDPSKIARQFEKSDKSKARPAPKAGTKAPVKAPVVEVNKICKICGKEPYMVERLVAEKSWWHKNCFRCSECNKTLNQDSYASHQGVIYCKPHQRDLFKPKAVITDLSEEIAKKNIDFASYDVDGDIVERHKKQERRHETIVRESQPVELKGVVKGKSDDSKWDGLDKLDVGSKFMMFEKAAEERERGEENRRQASDRYGIMEKLKRLQAGEDVSELLAEMDDDMPSDEEGEGEEDPEEYGLTEVQKKAHRSERLFDVDIKKEKLAMQRKVELKKLREKLMAGHRDNAVDDLEELNHRPKFEKTKVEVRSTNAKKFMNMFNNGEVPEGMNAGDRTTLEKDAELAMMRKNKRGERDYFKKMENGELDENKKKMSEPKLLIGKLRDMNGGWMGDDDDKAAETKAEEAKQLNTERMHAARECKASSVLNKFKDMEKRIANGEDLDEDKPRNRPQPRRFTPPRKLGEESGSEYSDSEYSYSSSDYSDSGPEDNGNGKDPEENEYLRNVREAARAKQLRAKFEEWEQGLGEDGGYTNLVTVDEDGHPLETASKLKNRFENLAVAEPPPPKAAKKYQVKRFKPKEAYEHQH